jgi:hypothetical protein
MFSIFCRRSHQLLSISLMLIALSNTPMISHQEIRRVW